MTHLPDVSIIVTCFNYGKYIERCVRSLLNQKEKESMKYEIIVVDDCSSDNTGIVVTKYKNHFSEISYLRNTQNRGLQYSCNHGIESSFGRYIVRVDADDYVSRHFASILKLVLDKNRDVQAVGCDYYEVDSDERTIRQVSSLDEPIACGVMYRRESIYDIGLYDENFKYREGHELNARFSAKYKIANLPIPLYFARKHGDNRSLNKQEIEKYENLIGKKNNATKKNRKQQLDSK